MLFLHNWAVSYCILLHKFSGLKIPACLKEYESSYFAIERLIIPYTVFSSTLFHCFHPHWCIWSASISQGCWTDTGKASLFSFLVLHCNTFIEHSVSKHRSSTKFSHLTNWQWCILWRFVQALRKGPGRSWWNRRGWLQSTGSIIASFIIFRHRLETILLACVGTSNGRHLWHESVEFVPWERQLASWWSS